MREIIVDCLVVLLVIAVIGLVLLLWGEWTVLRHVTGA